MNLHNLFNEFLGAKHQRVYTPYSGNMKSIRRMSSTIGEAFKSNKNILNGTKAVALGGVAGLLIGSHKARRLAGSAAKLGGAALLGGLAYKAVKNWHGERKSKNERTKQGMNVFSQEALPYEAETFEAQASENFDFQVVLIKAMIAAAMSDGHIDDTEHSRILYVVNSMNSSQDFKDVMVNLLRYPVSISDLAESTHGLEQKTEVYLISCIALDVGKQVSKKYLERLQVQLGIPDVLADQLRQQASESELLAA